MTYLVLQGQQQHVSNTLATHGQHRHTLHWKGSSNIKILHEQLHVQHVRPSQVKIGSCPQKKKDKQRKWNPFSSTYNMCGLHKFTSKDKFVSANEKALQEHSRMLQEHSQKSANVRSVRKSLHVVEQCQKSLFFVSAPRTTRCQCQLHVRPSQAKKKDEFLLANYGMPVKCAKLARKVGSQSWQWFMFHVGKQWFMFHVGKQGFMFHVSCR